jgi:hypothetical protein
LFVVFYPPRVTGGFCFCRMLIRRFGVY